MKWTWSEQLHRISIILQCHAQLLSLKSQIAEKLSEAGRCKCFFANDSLSDHNAGRWKCFFANDSLSDHNVCSFSALPCSAIPLTKAGTNSVPAIPKYEQPKQTGGRRKKRRTNPLTPEQAETLKEHVDALLGADWKITDLARAMEVDCSTVYRMLQGHSSKIENRQNLAAKLGERHSAQFTFNDLLDRNFDIANFRLPPETPSKA